jgi:uncharacterized protein (DUF433 family)
MLDLGNDLGAKQVMGSSHATRANSAETGTLSEAPIVSTPGTCGGKPRIDGHRIKVAQIAILYEQIGISPDEIVTELPTISLAQVHAALAYYYDHEREIDSDIDEGNRFIEELKAKSPPSKLQKLPDEARKAHGTDDSLPPR